MNRDSFVFYKSIFEAVDKIPKIEIQAQAYKAIALYGLCEIEPSENSDVFVQIIFAQAKTVMDNARKKYDSCVNNGKKGGRPRKENNQTITNEKPSNNQTKTKTKPKHNPTITNEKPSNNQTKTKTKPKHNPTITNEKPSNNLNDNVNVYVNDNVNVYKERDREKEQEFLKSLSQKFPQLKINVSDIDLNTYDASKLIQAISNSDYLQGATLTFILERYEKVINDYYSNFRQKKNTNQDFSQRTYTEEECKALFDNLDDIEV